MLIILALPSIAFALVPDALEMFGWDAEQASEQPWRYVTCHFVHLNVYHLSANLGALAILWWAWVAMDHRSGAASHRATPDFAWCTLVLGGAGAAIATGFALNVWGIAWYGGLSGLLYGVYAALALWLAMYPGRMGWMGVVLLFAAGAKAVIEVRTGAVVMGPLAIPVATPAHLYGYLGGLGGALLQGRLCLRVE